MTMVKWWWRRLITGITQPGWWHQSLRMDGDSAATIWRNPRTATFISSNRKHGTAALLLVTRWKDTELAWKIYGGRRVLQATRSCPGNQKEQSKPVQLGADTRKEVQGKEGTEAIISGGIGTARTDWFPLLWWYWTSFGLGCNVWWGAEVSHGEWSLSKSPRRSWPELLAETAAT